jgi:hypothetical protein
MFFIEDFVLTQEAAINSILIKKECFSFIEMILVCLGYPVIICPTNISRTLILKDAGLF